MVDSTRSGEDLGQSVRLDPGLVGVELMISAFLLDQLIMGSPFHDLPFFDHQNLMSLSNGAQAVGDDECGSPLHQGL